MGTNKSYTSFSILAKTIYSVPSYPMNLTETNKIGFLFFIFQFQYHRTLKQIWCMVTFEFIIIMLNSNGKWGTFCTWGTSYMELVWIWYGKEEGGPPKNQGKWSSYWQWSNKVEHA